jgi:DNA polymerase-1
MKTAVALVKSAVAAMTLQDLAANAPHHIPAMQAGAECWRCPLANCGAGPVPPTLPPNLELLVVAEAPGQTEIDEGQTLIGASGRETRGALRTAGFDPDLAGYTNTILCQPPEGDLKKFRTKSRKKGLSDPVECCRPRLTAEIRRAKLVVLMGAASLDGAGVSKSVMKLRGTPVQIPDGPPAVPILHAAFVLRDKGRHLRHVFRGDMAKAVRLSRGGNTWTDPKFFVVQDHMQLANFLSRPLPWWAVDTETDGVDPWTCKLRRIGVGSKDEVAIYAPLSVHGHPLMTDTEIESCRRVFNEFFGRAPKLCFHNYFPFDSIVLGQHGMLVPDDRAFDSIIGHHIGRTSELPHALDFLGSIYTDAPYWKDDVKHSNVKSDEILDRYLSFDIAVTWLSAPWIAQELATTDQEPIYNLDVRLAAIGRSMAALGIRVDTAAQVKFATEYQAKADKLKREFVDACGRDVNPASPVQIRQFLYHDLGLPILEEFETESGEASTAEPALLELLGMGVDRRAETVIKTLLGFREADKILGTYTGRIEDGPGIESRLVGGPPVHADGRLRTTWKVFGTTSGRWSSGDPNLQNVPKKLRAMYVPHPGNVFVAADFSALELRILALVSKDAPLIDAFRAFDAGKGPDIHVVNACTVFKCTPAEVTDEARTFAKRFVYGLSYGAQPLKIFQTMSLLRNDDLRPVFPNITLAEIERVYHTWWEMHPAITQWRRDLVSGWRRHGYIATPWHKRKRYFIGGENHEEQYNHPIQGGAADLQNQAVLALVNAYPFDFARHRGLVLQVHDQLVVECGADEAERVKRIVESAMTRRIDDMLFPAAAKTGLNWKVAS